MARKIKVIKSEIADKGLFNSVITSEEPLKPGEEYIVSTFNWGDKEVMKLLRDAIKLTECDSREEFREIKYKLMETMNLYKE